MEDFLNRDVAVLGVVEGHDLRRVLGDEWAQLIDPLLAEASEGTRSQWASHCLDLAGSHLGQVAEEMELLANDVQHWLALSQARLDRANRQSKENGELLAQWMRV